MQTPDSALPTEREVLARLSQFTAAKQSVVKNNDGS
jgi:hypothetical protein